MDNLAGRRYIGSVIVNDGNGRYYEPAPGRTWLLGGAEPTLADIAMVSYTSQAHIAGLPMADYPRIGAWVARLQALPGYVPLADTLAPPAQEAA